MDEGIPLRCPLPLLARESTPAYFDGPPRICALGFQLCNGHLQGLEAPGIIGDKQPVDFFAGAEWDYARRNAIKASRFMRSQGPFMPSILGPEEMEYTSRPAVLEELKARMVDNDPAPKDKNLKKGDADFE